MKTLLIALLLFLGQASQWARAEEAVVRLLPLSGPAAHRDTEISGLAWWGDRLILLAQFPERKIVNGRPSFFGLPKDDIVRLLEDPSAGPLTPSPIVVDDGGLRTDIRGYEGYEAVVFVGDDAYLTLEARADGKPVNYIVKGRMAGDGGSIRILPDSLTRLTPPALIPNMGPEALAVIDGTITVFFEANGNAVNPSPTAALFDADLKPVGKAVFPHIEYRITDAAMDRQGRLWLMNYFWPGERELLKPAWPDPLFSRFGRAPLPDMDTAVERIVQVRKETGGFEIAPEPPVHIELGPKKGRNWEGLAVLEGRGFLIATDKFPRTLLGFVPYEF